MKTLLIILFSIFSYSLLAEECQPSEKKIIVKGESYSILLPKASKSDFKKFNCKDLKDKDGKAKLSGSYSYKCDKDSVAWEVVDMNCQELPEVLMKTGWGSGPCWTGSSCGGGYTSGKTPDACPTGYTETAMKTACGNPNDHKSGTGTLADFYKVHGWGCNSGYVIGISVRYCKVN